MKWRKCKHCGEWVRAEQLKNDTCEKCQQNGGNKRAKWWQIAKQLERNGGKHG